MVQSALHIRLVDNFERFKSLLKVVALGKFHVFKRDNFQPSRSLCHVILKKRGLIPK